MTRGKKSKKFPLIPIGKNLFKKLSNTDIRVRRKMLRTLGVIVCLFLLYTVFSGDYGFIRIAKLHLKKHRLQKANHELLVKLVDAEMTTKRLKHDLDYIEYIARTKHFMSKPGEIIYRLNR